MGEYPSHQLSHSFPLVAGTEVGLNIKDSGLNTHEKYKIVIKKFCSSYRITNHRPL